MATQWAVAGTLHPSIAALPDFGELRQRLSISRGAIELGLPEQDVVRDADGNWELSVQPRTRADMWNSQVSGLLSGTTICIYDGSPAGKQGAADWSTLWRFAADAGVTFFGANACAPAGRACSGIASASAATRPAKR